MEIFLDRDNLRQLRGAVELLTDTVDATVADIEEAHHAIARWPYAWLAWIPGAGTAARAIGRVQHALTAISYGAVRALNRVVRVTATCTLDHMDRRAVTREP
jgi:hypothetical protein